MKHYFDPDELRTMCAAFDLALSAVEEDIGRCASKTVRDHIGKAIVKYAQEGFLDKSTLADYAARRGRGLLSFQTKVRLVDCER